MSGIIDRVVRFFRTERVLFVVTNWIPRRYATILFGRFSRIENRWVRDASIAVWRRCAPELALDEARKERFESLHDCFIRELKPGARPIDPRPEVVTSPCDAIVGACGRVDGTTIVQAKGLDYTLEELLGDDELVARHRDGVFVTLRLTSSMYHRFHAPCDGTLSRVNYISGDTFNVDPISVKRIERLFCRNERVVMPLETPPDLPRVTLVAVAAILVAGVRLHCLPEVLDLRYGGPNHLDCDGRYAKGDEMGYFQHGSTILLFASGWDALDDAVTPGRRLRVGEPLLRRTATDASP